VWDCYEAIGPIPGSDEWVETGLALIPASVLNQYGPPQVYSHDYTFFTRCELLQLVRKWEASADSLDPVLQADEVQRLRQRVATLRAVRDLLDEIGWLTPLAVKEQQERDKK
jgi:hypothetical protein